MQTKSSSKADWLPSTQSKIVQNSNKTNSNLCLRNMGVERKYNSETVSFQEENSKNIRANKRKSNKEN